MFYCVAEISKDTVLVFKEHTVFREERHKFNYLLFKT